MVKTGQDTWLKQDEQFVWHSMKPYNPAGTMVVTESNGSWVTDHEGKKYLDGMAGLWCVNVGYGRQELAEAAYEQLKKMAYFPLTQSHQPAIQLAEKLNGLLGDDYVIFFSNSGSEANETAFKIARQYHQQKGEGERYKIVSRYRAYHGNSMGALAATGQAQRKYKYEPLAPGFIHVAPPDSYRDDANGKSPHELPGVKAIDQAMTWELSETVAAVIMEPIITGGGILVPQEGYMKAVKEVCENHGALLIVDEVICGFGRTGKPFGFMNYDVKPDIITMAKGITSAYLPLSATAVKREIYEAFKGSEEYDYFRHINTFGGNPAACALAVKNIEIMENEDLFARSAELGETAINTLKNQLQDHPLVGDVRGKGLLIGIEMVKDRQSKEPLEVDVVNKVISYCKQNGVIIGKNGATVAGYNNVLTLSPPLTIDVEDLELLLSTVIEGIKQV
ncbi:aminotransferase [[Bacillus] enclensis]|uniref:Adenosylmethionine-8-amino-7-oxononanoate aminotransferase n=1 Tax=[Bacillus] enclensis TaxID=1402860 RepID=A0A0V8HKB9_9BACI|nr:aspartate aminotransferase family protein [[Bacillus] enclensis]KSU62609.1 aminotransferase [[Bacillus] enclensis]OAT82747.1 aminotransferase [Bacillus sp. MKU004]SCC06907.1 Adenosylmethionine-8-amino-7-oxononanoate aminotransferase [[Bacillus] enclensis]